MIISAINVENIAIREGNKMRVAIIGAGISGLACAHELQRLGIETDIFERKDKVGEIFPHVAAFLQIVNRPVKDPLKYINERYFISLEPVTLVKEIAMHSPNTTSSIKGRALGYFMRRGQDQASVENQLASKILSPIHFNTQVDAQELSKEYDAVVVASGNPEITKQIGIWKTLVDTWVHGAVVLGDFDTHKLEMWVDTTYANSGYAYLCPFNEKSALIALAASYINEDDLKPRWDLFWKKANFPYEIVQSFQLPHVSGYVFPHKVANLYFVGNAGGFLEPFLGFGQFHALTTGVTAARCIAENKDFETELKPFLKEIMQMLELRKAIDSFKNKDFDRLVEILGIPGLNQFIYNTNINVIKHSSSLLGAVSKVSLKKLFNRKK